MNIKRILACITIAIVIFSCKDDDAGPTKTQLLTGKAWQLKELEIDGDVQDLPACFDDDEIYFFTDGLFEWIYNEDVCSEDAPLYFDGEWEFRDNETVIMWEIAGESEFEIIELTSTVFRIRLLDEDVDQILTLEVID